MEEETDFKELAERCFLEGKYDEALSNFQELLEEQTSVLGRTHEDALHTQSRIASVFEKQMNYADAVRTLIILYKNKLRALGILNESSVESRCRIAELLKKHSTTLLKRNILCRVESAMRMEMKIARKMYLSGKYLEALNSVIYIYRNTVGFLIEDNQIIERLAVLLGKIYLAKEDYVRALRVFSEIHRNTENRFGPEDLRTATSLMGMASVLHKMCKYEEALKLYLQAHKIRETILGLYHKETLFILFSIGRLHTDAGNYDNARFVLKEVLKHQKKKRGRVHTLIAIGLSYKGKCQYKLALDTFKKAYKVEKISVRKKAEIRNHIGTMLTMLGKYYNATLVLKECIKMRKLSNYHADTLSTYRDMAVKLAREGKIVTSQALLNALVQASDRTLGSRHSTTLSIQQDLALLYFHLQLYNEALYTFTNIWKVRYEDLGPHHPDTIYAKFLVARVNRMQGKFDMALTMYNQVWSLQKAILYPYHSDLLTVEAEIANTYFILESFPAAFQMIYEIFEKKVKMYATNHPLISKAKEEVADFGNHIEMDGLIAATFFGSLEKVKMYLEEGHDVNVRDCNGSVSLHYATRDGYIDILKYLLSKGAIYNITDMFGQTPVSFTKDYAIIEVFLLVERLFENVKMNNRDEVRRILKQENSIINARDERHRTPLYYAVSRKYAGIVRDLIDHGANPLLANNEDGTVLHAAAKKSDSEIMAFLLRHVSRKYPEELRNFLHNKKNCLELAPLHYAVMADSAACVHVLMQYRVNPMEVDVFGRMAFDLGKTYDMRSNILCYSLNFLNMIRAT